jgi:hypothetical protein
MNRRVATFLGLRPIEEYEQVDVEVTFRYEAIRPHRGGAPAWATITVVRPLPVAAADMHRIARDQESADTVVRGVCIEMVREARPTGGRP